MKLFILRWLSNAIALYITDLLIPGIWFKNWTSFFISAFVLGLLNAFIRPVLLFLTLPLNIFTLGIFTIFLNAAIFFSVGYIVHDFMITGYGWAIVSSLVFSVFTTTLSWIFERREFRGRFHLWRF